MPARRVPEGGPALTRESDASEIVFRNGDMFQIKVGTPGVARGLYAAIYQRPDWCTPEEYEAGMMMHGFYLSTVQELALDYEKATGKKRTG